MSDINFGLGAGTLNTTIVQLFRWLIGENTIHPFHESTKVIQLTSFIDHFGKESLWYIVIKIQAY